MLTEYKDLLQSVQMLEPDTKLFEGNVSLSIGFKGFLFIESSETLQISFLFASINSASLFKMRHFSFLNLIHSLSMLALWLCS